MPDRIPLTDVAPGRTVLVVEIRGGHGVTQRLRALGIRPGVKVTKLGGGVFGRGPALIQHGQTQTALGNGVCKKIIVEVVK